MKLLLLVAIVAVALADRIPHPDTFPMRLRNGPLFARATRHHARLEAMHGLTRNATVNWFTQWIDHTNHSLGTFQQRYYVDSSSWNGTGPVLIYIEGEAPLTQSPGGFPAVYGKSIGALMISVEHRFYGASMPFPITDTPNLKYLTVEQALADFNNFMNVYEATIMKKRLRYFIVGGSYAGAISAWFKVRYPTRVLASWSSSGVVNALFNFWPFDNHIRRVIQPQCADLLRDVYATFSTMWDDPTQKPALLSLFGTPTYFTKTDMAWMLGDAAAGAVQYGNKEFMCNALLANTTSMGLMPAYAAFIQALWGPGFGSSCYYSTVCLSNQSMSSQWVGADYCWIYQTCSELAYWAVGYPNSVRSELVTVDYFTNQCRTAYWPTITADTFAFNKKFGGDHPNATHVIALQGSDDPWSTAGVRHPLGPDYPEVLAQCDGCGHCGDLFTPEASDPETIVAQRKQIVKYMNKWLGL